MIEGVPLPLLPLHYEPNGLYIETPDCGVEGSSMIEASAKGHGRNLDLRSKSLNENINERSRKFVKPPGVWSTLRVSWVIS